MASVYSDYVTCSFPVLLQVTLKGETTQAEMEANASVLAPDMASLCPLEVIFDVFKLSYMPEDYMEVWFGTRYAYDKYMSCCRL